MRFTILCLLVASLTIGSLGASYADGGKKITPPNTTKEIIATNVKNTSTDLDILNEYFARDIDTVFAINETRNDWIPIPDADRVSFEVLRGRFARDVDTIFYREKALENINVGTFSVLSGRHGYATDDIVVIGPQGVIPDADPDTFEIINPIYSRDAGQVYAYGKFIDAASESFEVINSIHTDEDNYAHDATRVFYKGNLLAQTSPEGFRVEGDRAFTSDGRTFFAGKIEKGELPINVDTGVDTIDTVSNVGIVSSITALLDSFSGEKWTHYRDILMQDPWRNIAGLVGIMSLFLLSLFFTFFTERYGNKVSFVGTCVKFLIALGFGVLTAWLIRSYTTLGTILTIACFVAGLIFLMLNRTNSVLRNIFAIILSIITYTCLVVCIGIIISTFIPDETYLNTIIGSDQVQRGIIYALTGGVIGTLLIHSQIRDSLVRSGVYACLATAIALTTSVLMSTLVTSNVWVLGGIFVSIFSVIIWLLHVRSTDSLIVMTARVMRMLIIMGLIVGLLTWMIL